jgi:hypothetical protein
MSSAKPSCCTQCSSGTETGQDVLHARPLAAKRPNGAFPREVKNIHETAKLSEGYLGHVYEGFLQSRLIPFPLGTGSLVRRSLRIELQCHRVDAVAEPGWSRAVVEHVAQVRAAVLARHLGADHQKTAVGRFLEFIFGHRFGKTRPATIGIELVAGIDQRGTATDAAIHAVLRSGCPRITSQNGIHSIRAD